MTAVVGLARCPGYAGSNDKWDIRMLNDVNSDSKQSEAKKMYDTYARMAFISIIAMVFPMHACGPAMKVKYERVGWTLSGSFSHRSGRNLKKHSLCSLVEWRLTYYVARLHATYSRLNGWVWLANSDRRLAQANAKGDEPRVLCS